MTRPRVNEAIVPGPPQADLLPDNRQATQILLNLALNAASAMGDSETRQLKVHVAADILTRRDGEAGKAPFGREGGADAVFCLVGDSGPGVQIADPERIFDPFFTTKAPGEGTGLGLANARKLAREMGGAVELVEGGSSMGGALFRFCLPREPSSVQSTGDVQIEPRR